MNHPGRRRHVYAYPTAGGAGARHRSALSLGLSLGLLGAALLLLSSSSLVPRGGGVRRFLRETIDDALPRVVRRTSEGRWEFVTDPVEAADFLPPPPPPLSILALGGP